MEYIKNQRCKKVLVYHNVTPAEFLVSGNDAYKALEILKENFELYDYFVGVSQFNANDLRKLGLKKECDILPILLDFNESDNSKIESETTNFLFVGRIAPNKKDEDIIDIFNYYYKFIDANSNLYFVGNYDSKSNYYDELQEKLKKLECRSHIYFTGKVTDEELSVYYRKADIFICMSEHEGFCIPVLEGMHYNLPVIAYDACAIPETMGDAGILTYTKEPEVLAKLIYTILTTDKFKDILLKKQKERVITFSEDGIKTRLEFLIKKWRA